jgi:hypothetical protein
MSGLDLQLHSMGEGVREVIWWGAYVNGIERREYEIRRAYVGREHVAMKGAYPALVVTWGRNSFVF